MSINDALTIVAIFSGPLIAILISMWNQSRKQNKDAKMMLFLDILAHHKQIPIQSHYVAALNKICVLFHRNPKVITRWEKLYDSFGDKPYSADRSERNLLDMLDEMARDLGYKNLKPTSYLNKYSPQQYEDDLEFQFHFRQEIMRLMKASDNLGFRFAPPAVQGSKEEVVQEEVQS